MDSENNENPVYEAMDTLHGVQRGQSSPGNGGTTSNDRQPMNRDVISRPTSSLHGQSGTEDQERRKKHENAARGSSSGSDSADSEETSPAKNPDRQGSEGRHPRKKSRSPHR